MPTISAPQGDKPARNLRELIGQAEQLGEVTAVTDAGDEWVVTYTATDAPANEPEPSEPVGDPAPKQARRKAGTKESRPADQ